MSRRLRIAAIGSMALVAISAAALVWAYWAARQVRPFYQQALQLAPEVLAKGNRELESRASALYSDARKAGAWQALFTDEQINGWLAVQLEEPLSAGAGELTEGVREPRVAISPDLLTLGFTTRQKGVETVVSVDAAVFLTEEGDVAIRLKKVRAGTLPLPIMLVADQIASACQRLSLPVLWSQQDGVPIAMIKIGVDDPNDGRRWHIDAIELNEAELYVAGHTQIVALGVDSSSVELDDFELRLAPSGKRTALEVARKRSKNRSQNPRRP